MIFLNIFLCIIISVYESLALKSMRPDGEIPNRDGMLSLYSVLFLNT